MGHMYSKGNHSMRCDIHNATVQVVQGLKYTFTMTTMFDNKEGSFDMCRCTVWDRFGYLQLINVDRLNSTVDLTAF